VSSPALLLAGLLLVAINLRPAAASVGPLLHRIESGAGLSNGWAGALTTLPVLCFGLLAPAAPLLAQRFGAHRTVAVAMVLLTAGQAIRLIAGAGFLFLGTALAGAAIAIGNVLVPVVVRRDFAERSGTVMSLFSAGLVGAAALAAAVSVPAADALGGGWRPGLAIWALPAALAALAWLPVFRVRGEGPVRGHDPGETHGSALRTVLRSRLAWQVTLFFAFQSAGFYATLAWLPSIFRSHGFSEGHAGLLLSLALVVGVFTGLVVPELARRQRDQRALVALFCLLIVVGWLGILLWPTTASYLWVILLGLGQNAAFPLALMLIVLRGGTVSSTGGLSTLAQSVGYCLAAAAPLAVGAIHGLTHSWTPDILVLIALVLPQFVFGLGAGRNQQITAGPEAPQP
jgi:CP family cyanate transporter-like MFS transporter